MLLVAEIVLFPRLLFYLSFNLSLMLAVCFSTFFFPPFQLVCQLLLLMVEIFLTSDVRLFTLKYYVLLLVIFHSENRSAGLCRESWSQNISPALIERNVLWLLLFIQEFKRDLSGVWSAQYRIYSLPVSASLCACLPSICCSTIRSPLAFRLKGKFRGWYHRSGNMR